MAMREVSPQEVREECAECQGSSRKEFKDINELVEYIEKKIMYFDQHLCVIRQYHAEGYIDCPVCAGRGYLTRRI